MTVSVQAKCRRDIVFLGKWEYLFSICKILFAMTRVVTFSSGGLYGYESFRDCLLTETFREGSLGAILLTIISSRIIWFRPRLEP